MSDEWESFTLPEYIGPQRCGMVHSDRDCCTECHPFPAPPRPHVYYVRSERDGSQTILDPLDFHVPPSDFYKGDK